MKRVFLFAFFLALFSIEVQAQKGFDKPGYRKPVDLPMKLAGTFGELRPDHFHSGIDIRTNGVEGLPVYAVADGFVSRIAVSPVGFGKAVYIDHPSTGHTSVYGHLQRFEGRIAQWVKAQQYEKESFTINIYTKPELFPIKRGDIIGYSGNSGSSGGPHLHFELRDAPTQEILNPLKFGYMVNDKLSPTLLRLAVYPEGRHSEINGKRNAIFREVTGWGKQHRLKNPQPIAVSGSVSLGISTHDTQNDVPNKNGVYSVELFVNQKPVFEFKADRFSFDETRYINSLIDYGYLQEKGSRIIRTRIDPLNKLGMYGKVADNGVLSLLPGDTLHALFVVKDFNGNESRLPFVLFGVPATLGPEKVTTDTTLQWVEATKAKRIHTQFMAANFPAATFYHDQEIAVRTAKMSPGQYSDQITVGSAGIPAHKSFDLRIRLNTIPKDTDKLTVVLLDKGKPSPIGGKYENGWITVSSRKLGTFTVMADSIRPEVKAVNFASGTKIDSLKSLIVHVKDDFSGVDKIHHTLNGKWILMDYDPKNNRLSYEVDERLLQGRNTLKIRATDKCGNFTEAEWLILR